MDINKFKQAKRERLRKKTRRKIGDGTAEVPRLSVYRSNKYIYVQLIDDYAAHTLASSYSRQLTEKGSKTEIAYKVGQDIAEKAKAKNISKIKFDRGPYKYHGRIKQVAEGAREGGLEF